MKICGQVWMETEGHRGARMGREWCRGLCNVNLTRKQPKGGHGEHVGTHLCVHVAGAKQEKKQIFTERQRFVMTESLDILGFLLLVDSHGGANGTQWVVRRGTGGHDQTCFRRHVNMPNRKEQNGAVKLTSKMCKACKNDKPKTRSAKKWSQLSASKRGGKGVRGNREQNEIIRVSKNSA